MCLCLSLFVCFFGGFFCCVYFSFLFFLCVSFSILRFGSFRVFLYVFSTAGYRTAGALQYLVVTPFVIIGCELWTSGWHLMRSSHGTNKLGSCPPALALILIKLYVLPRAYSKDLLKNMRLLQISWTSGNVTSWSVMRRFRHSSPPPTSPLLFPQSPRKIFFRVAVICITKSLQ